MGKFSQIIAKIKRQAVIAACLLFFHAGCPAHTALAEPLPQRVVSINLCTDQLAMLLADQSQLHSVSVVASDPVSSALAQQAANYVQNHGQVEEIILMQPDLVLASIYTSREKLALLRQLGLRVEEFGVSQSVADIRSDVRRMGRLLGHEQRAEALIAQMDQELSGLQPLSSMPRALLFEPNGLTSGIDTLASETMRLAGLYNLALEDAALAQGRVGMEQLVLLHPDLLIKPLPYDKPALAYANYEHPALRNLKSVSGRDTLQVVVPTSNWACGTPALVNAAQILNDAALAIAGGSTGQNSQELLSEGVRP